VITGGLLFWGIYLAVFYPLAWAHKKHHSGHASVAEETFRTPSERIDATYSDWMGRNQEALKDMPVNHVPLLGSHDAGSCDVSLSSPPCRGYLTHKGNHIHRMPKGTDVTSARCQSATIKDQLRYGVRYLDLRIALQDGSYWIEHMWMSTALAGEGGVFTQILEFLQEHPREIVILNMQALYSETGEMNAEEAAAYFRMVESQFGEIMMPAGEFASVTMRDLWARNARLIVIGDTERSPLPFLWDVRKVDSRWMNKQDSVKLCHALNSKVIKGWRKGKSHDRLRVLQAMTTTKHKIKQAETTNADIREWLSSQWSDAPVNVVQADDAVNSGLMPVLIERIENDKKQQMTPSLIGAGVD
jgi:hypothetical protein